MSDYTVWVPSAYSVEEKEPDKQHEDSVDQEDSVASQSGCSEDENSS